MSKKIKVINNIHGGLGFFLNPTPESFRLLKTQGAFINILEEELDYIYINQEIIQKGMLWIEDKEKRVEYGIEKEDGTKENMNVLKHDEIVDLIQGNYKALEKAINKITEKDILIQFAETARELKIDSKAKIDIIETASGMKIYDEE